MYRYHRPLFTDGTSLASLSTSMVPERLRGRGRNSSGSPRPRSTGFTQDTTTERGGFSLRCCTVEDLNRRGFGSGASTCTAAVVAPGSSATAGFIPWCFGTSEACSYPGRHRVPTMSVRVTEFKSTSGTRPARGLRRTRSRASQGLLREGTPSVVDVAWESTCGVGIRVQGTLLLGTQKTPETGSLPGD